MISITQDRSKDKALKLKPSLSEVFERIISEPTKKKSEKHTNSYVNVRVIKATPENLKALGIKRKEAPLYLELSHGNEQGGVLKKQLIPLPFQPAKSTEKPRFDSQAIGKFISPRTNMDKHTMVVSSGSGFEVGNNVFVHIPTSDGDFHFKVTPEGNVELNRAPSDLAINLETFGSVKTTRDLACRSLTFKAKNIDNAHRVSAQTIQIRDSKKLTNSGLILSEAFLDLSGVQEIENKKDAIFASRGKLRIKRATEIQNQGMMGGREGVDVEALNKFINDVTETVISESTLDLKLGAENKNQGWLLGKYLNLTGGSLENGLSGEIRGEESCEITCKNIVRNQGGIGVERENGRCTVRAVRVINEKEGQMKGGQKLKLTAKFSAENKGIMSGNIIDCTVTGILVGFIQNFPGGKIEAGSFLARCARFINEGYIGIEDSDNGTCTVDAVKIINEKEGLIKGGQKLKLTAKFSAENKGIMSGNTIDCTVTGILVGFIQNFPGGKIEAGRFLARCARFINQGSIKAPLITLQRTLGNSWEVTLDNEEGVLIAEQELVLNQGSINNHKGLLKAGKIKMNATGWANNRRGKILAEQTVEMSIWTSVQNAGGSILGKQGVTIQKSAVLARVEDGKTHFAPGKAKLEFLSCVEGGTIYSDEGKVRLEVEKIWVDDTSRIWGSEETEIEGMHVHFSTPVVGKTIRIHGDLLDLERGLLSSSSSHQVTIEQSKGVLSLRNRWLGGDFTIRGGESLQNRAILLVQRLKLLANSFDIKQDIKAKGDVTLETSKQEVGNSINLEANITTRTGNIIFKAHSLSQAPSKVIGSKQDTSEIHFLVKKLYLQGVLGPKGKFKTDWIEEWQLPPHHFQAEIGLYLKLSLNRDYDFNHAIDLEHFSLEMASHCPHGSFRLRFLEAVLAKQDADIRANGFRVQMGDSSNRDLKQMRAGGSLDLETFALDVPFAALVGTKKLTIKSQSDVVIGRLDMPNKTSHLRSEGDCILYLKGSLKTYYTYIDVNGKFSLTATKEWDDVANQITIGGEVSLDTPLNIHRILTKTTTSRGPISNIGNVHWARGIVTRIFAISPAPTFIMATTFESTGTTKMLGGQLSYHAQIKGTAPIVENFIETHVDVGHYLGGHKKARKAWLLSYKVYLSGHGKQHLASCGMQKTEYKQATLALPGHYRAGELTLSKFNDCFIGTLENIQLGSFRPFRPIIDVIASARPNSAIQVGSVDSLTILENILELTPKFPTLPRVVIQPNGFNLHSTLRPLYPWREENKLVATAILSNIGQFPPEFQSERLDLAALQHWLMKNTLEWIQENQGEANSRALTQMIQKPTLMELKKPILLYQEIEYQHADGHMEKGSKPMVVIPNSYEQLWLQPGGSLMAEILTILGAKNAHLHITHAVKGRKSLEVDVDHILLETRAYTHEEIIEQTETKKTWCKKKTKTIQEKVVCSEIQQVAALATDGKLKITGKTFFQKGSEVRGGSEETRLNIGYHQVEPVLERSIESYQDSQRTLLGKKSIQGQIIKTKNVFPSKVIGEGNIVGEIGTGHYTAIQIESQKGHIHLLYKLGVQIYTKVVDQHLPPHIAKQGQLLTVGKTTLQYGVTSLFRAIAGKILLESEGIYHSKGTQYLAKDKIEITGQEVKEEAQVLTQRHMSKTSGITGLQFISQTQTLNQETAMSSNFMTSNEGKVEIRSTAGPATLVAPSVQTGTLKLSASGGDANILPLMLQKNITTETRSAGLKFTGSEVLEAVMQKDFALAARSLLQVLPILSSMNGLLKAEDTADKVGEGVKTAYYIYKLYQSLSEGKGIGEVLAGQIDTTVKIRFGTEEVEEKGEDVQLAWLGARAIILESTQDVNLKGTQSDAEHLVIRAEKKVNIEGVEQLASKEQTGSGFSVGGDVVKMLPYAGMDFREAEHQAKRYIATRFDKLKTLFIEGKEINLKHAVQFETEQAFLRAERFNIEEGIDTEQGKHKAFNVDTALNVGLQYGHTSVQSVEQTTGIKASHTFYADIKKQTHLIGGHIFVDSKGIPIAVQGLGDQQQLRYEHGIPPDGDCAFTGLGIHRIKKPGASYLTLEDLIGHADEEGIRKLVAPEIRAAFLTGQLPWQRHIHLTTRYSKKQFTDLQTQYQTQRNIEQALDIYSQDKAVFIDFLELEYLGKQNTPERWLSYLSEGTSTLDALAQLNNLNITIWKQSGGAIKPVHLFVWSETARMCELYHTWDNPAPRGYQYTENSENHFNLLTSKPGALYTETLTHEDIISHSKKHQGGIQIGLSEFGMTDVHYQREHKEQTIQATISGGIDVVAKQSSNPNRDESQYQLTKEKKTHVRMVVPHEWAKKGIEVLTTPKKEGSKDNQISKQEVTPNVKEEDKNPEKKQKGKPQKQKNSHKPDETERNKNAKLGENFSNTREMSPEETSPIVVSEDTPMRVDKDFDLGNAFVSTVAKLVGVGEAHAGELNGIDEQAMRTFNPQDKKFFLSGVLLEDLANSRGSLKQDEAHSLNQKNLSSTPKPSPASKSSKSRLPVKAAKEMRSGKGGKEEVKLKQKLTPKTTNNSKTALEQFNDAMNLIEHVEDAFNRGSGGNVVLGAVAGGAVSTLQAISESITILTDAGTVADGLEGPAFRRDRAFTQAFNRNRAIAQGVDYAVTHPKETGHHIVGSIGERLQHIQTEYALGNELSAGFQTGRLGGDIGISTLGVLGSTKMVSGIVKSTAKGGLNLAEKGVEIGSKSIHSAWDSLKSGSVPQAVFSEVGLVNNSLLKSGEVLSAETGIAPKPLLNHYGIHKKLHPELQQIGHQGLSSNPIVSGRKIASGRTLSDGMFQKRPIASHTETQLSDKGLLHPEPILPAELSKVKSWEGARNFYLKKWRDIDVSKVSNHIQELLINTKVDNAIRHRMTADDLAGILKEGRGVEISGKGGKVVDHFEEWRQAQKAFKNVLDPAKEKFKKLTDAGKSNTLEAQLLQEKISDLSKMKDLYTELTREAKCQIEARKLKN